MRRKGDYLLPARCSKTTALQLVDDALTVRSLDSGRQIAEECLHRGYIFNRTEQVLLCIAVFAASETRYATRYHSEPTPIDELWEEATSNLPAKDHDVVAGYLIRLADIYLERDQLERAWNALFAAEQYVESRASRLQFNAALERYQALKQPPRLGTVIDLRL